MLKKILLPLLLIAFFAAIYFIIEINGEKESVVSLGTSMKSSAESELTLDADSIENAQFLATTVVSTSEDIAKGQAVILAVDSRGNEIYITFPKRNIPDELLIEENIIPDNDFIAEYPAVTNKYIKVTYSSNWIPSTNERRIAIKPSDDFDSIFAYLQENDGFPKLIPFSKNEESDLVNFSVKTRYNSFTFALVRRED